MAKSKTFRSNADGMVSVAVPGHSIQVFMPGDEVETDDAAVIAAFEANPDLDEAKGGARRARAEPTRAEAKADDEDKGK